MTKQGTAIAVAFALQTLCLTGIAFSADVPPGNEKQPAERWLTTIEQKYDLAKTKLIAPAANKIAEKQRHGENEFLFQGKVTVDQQNLVLGGSAGYAWAAPQLWSGLKNVTVSARMRIDAAPEKASFGIKFGRVWSISGGGSRIVFKPAAGTVSYLPDKDKPATAEAKVKVPVGEWFVVTAENAFDKETVEVTLNGQSVLKMPMPQTPFEGFMERFGRPAPLAGIGVFAEGCDLRVQEFSFRAGAPQRRVVAIGDSITQQHYWVQELEKALGEKVTNLGIGGDAAKMAAWRFERDVIPLKPEICVILLGSNDIGWMTSKTDELALNFLRPMVRAAKTAGIRPLVGEILPRRDKKNMPPWNAAIHKMCEAEGVPVLAWYDATYDAATGEMKPGFSADGIHPIRAGGAAMIKGIDLGLFTRK